MVTGSREQEIEESNCRDGTPKTKESQAPQPAEDRIVIQAVSNQEIRV